MRPMRASVVLFLFVSALASSAPAQSDKIDEYVTAEMRKQNIPGLSLAVVRNGEIIKAKGYGLANVELNVAATPETIYQSGSIGKQFTATLVMMLVEAGTMSLDDRIGKYIEDASPLWKDITVRHLLTHTSGLSNKLYDHIDMRRDYTEDELVQQIAALPLDFEPGEKWSYSNPGYVLLGILIHKATGRFYGDLLREKIFGPLGMTTARVLSEADIVPNRAAGYRLVEGAWKNQQWVSPSLNTTADGALYLTVLDLARWDAALYSDKLLKRASLDLMWTPAKLNSGKTKGYGFGWELDEIRGHRIIEHGGGWQGFTAYISRYVDDKLTIIVLTNLAGVYPQKIVNGIAGLYNAELAPIERTAIRLDPKIIDAYIGDYELASGRVVKILREGDTLWLQPPNQTRIALLAESETSFFPEGINTRFTFAKDDSGRVTRLLILYADGDQQEAQKIR